MMKTKAEIDQLRAKKSVRGAAYYAANRDTILARQKEYRAANPEKARATIARWVAKNPEKERARHAAWASANPEKVRAANARYIATHPQRLAKLVEWGTTHPERMREAKAAWATANPDAVRAYTHNRRALKRNAVGKASPDLRGRLLVLQRGKCANCHAKFGKIADHMDHIIPLSKGGTNEDHNIQLLCQSCNQRKHAKPPIAFAQSQGRLL